GSRSDSRSAEEPSQSRRQSMASACAIFSSRFPIRVSFAMDARLAATSREAGSYAARARLDAVRKARPGVTDGASCSRGAALNGGRSCRGLLYSCLPMVFVGIGHPAKERTAHMATAQFTCFPREGDFQLCI